MLSIDERLTRAAELCRLIDEEGYTLQEAGQEFGITRERASQIYYHEKKAKRGLLRSMRKEITRAKREVSLDEIRFVCLGCQKAITRRESKWGHKYCVDCRPLSKTRDLARTEKCTNCGTEFHPFRNYRGGIIGKFCSRQCYFTYPERTGRPRGKKVGTEGEE